MIDGSSCPREHAYAARTVPEIREAAGGQAVETDDGRTIEPEDYDPSGYAKNALKRYVPRLTTTYNAGGNQTVGSRLLPVIADPSGSDHR